MDHQSNIVRNGRALPTQDDLPSSPSDAQQQPEPDMASSLRNTTWVSSPPPMSPITPLPHEQHKFNMTSPGDSSTVNGTKHGCEPRSSSLPADPAPFTNRSTTSPSLPADPAPFTNRSTTSPSPSQTSTEPDENTTPSSPTLSPLAQHLGTLAQPLIYQLARAAIDQDTTRLEALSHVERQIELAELCRRTTTTALETVALDWARKLKEQGGAEGEFIEVERATKEFESFKFARLAYVEERARRGVAGSSGDDAASNYDEYDMTRPESLPHDYYQAIDSNSDDARSSSDGRTGSRQERRSTTTVTTAAPTPADPSAAFNDQSLTHYAPNVYGDASIPSHLKYFVPGRFQHLTVADPSTSPFISDPAALPTGALAPPSSSSSSVRTVIFDQTTRFPLNLPNGATGITDVIPLPQHLARTEDWESRRWVVMLNAWHVALLHERHCQPAKRVRFKWTEVEKRWLTAWVAERIKQKGDDDDDDDDMDEALTRAWNAFAVSDEGVIRGLRRRDGPVLADARRRWCIDHAEGR